MRTRMAVALTLAILILIGWRTNSVWTMEEDAIAEATPQESPVVVRRVWVGGADDVHPSYSSPSPDGRLVTFVDWTTGDLAVRDLVTGETRRLTNTGGWSESNEYARASVFSPDGRQIVYVWTSGSGLQLRLTDVDGSPPRLLYQSTGYMSVLSWSPDGADVLIGRRSSADDVFGELVLISVEDGSHRVLRENLPHLPHTPGSSGFSPDGRYIGYNQPSAERGGKHDVVVLAAEGGREVRVTRGPGHNVYLGWAPDGSRVYFYSYASGTPSIWAVPVSDGEASGPPELIRRDVEDLQPIGVGGGKLLYFLQVEGPGIQTMALDIPSGRVLTGATGEVGPANGTWGGFPAWSSDGRYLAYACVTEETAVLVIRSVSGNNLRQLPMPELVGMTTWIGWAPDSKGIVVGGGQRTALISLATGEVDVLLGHGLDRAALSPDGKTLYAPVGYWAVASYDLESGSETLLYEQSPRQRGLEIMDLSLAPDGQTLAIGFSSGIAVMPVSGGGLRWIYRGEPGAVRWQGGMPWTPDGRTILFVQSEGLWAVPVSGAEPRKLFSMPSLQHVRLHPDGRRLAFMGGPTRRELWVMENAPGFGSE